MQQIPTRILGLLGSSRKGGNTDTLTSAVFEHLSNARLIDLGDYSIAPYDYQHRYVADGFIPLARLMAKADAIVFASPVYWYSMSAPMKTFFDRLTDLTESHKELGRQLAGKTVFVISTSSGPTAPVSFEQPFSETARYFKMHWGGMLHAVLTDDCQLPEGASDNAKGFAARIEASIVQANPITA
ncbi:MAG: NAD(P)H-dependent oxidoreductase [Alphaproteobacteria bacterium]|nr:NAD(P)H-dependent oxidoreductase [Alphaproteobacteria bacterium]